MTAGSLDSETDAMFRQIIDVLGDPITYKPYGGSSQTIRAIVDHSDETQEFGGVQITNQGISIEVLKADVPTVNPADEFTLPELGQTFVPNGAARNNRDGRHWHITLKRKRT